MTVVLAKGCMNGSKGHCALRKTPSENTATDCSWQGDLWPAFPLKRNKKNSLYACIMDNFTNLSMVLIVVSGLSNHSVIWLHDSKTTQQQQFHNIRWIREDNTALFCATGRISCITESDGDWYLPNGAQLANDSTQTFRRNQTIGFNNITDHKLHNYWSLSLWDDRR